MDVAPHEMAALCRTVLLAWRCPACGGAEHDEEDGHRVCRGCGAEWAPRTPGLWVRTAKEVYL